MRLRFLVILFFLSLFNLSASGQCLDKSNWELVFEDNFDYPVEELSKNWAFEYTWGNFISIAWCEQYNALNTPENCSIKDGILQMEIKKSDTTILYQDQEINYTTSMLRSKYEDPYCKDTPESKGGYLYGMFEIRCKMPKGSGAAAAFWLTGHNAWPPEFDVFEYTGSQPNEFFSTHHWWAKGCPREDCSCAHYYIKDGKKDFSEEFHTYSLVWTPKEIVWYYDDVEIKRSTENIPQDCNWRKMDMILSLAYLCPNGKKMLDRSVFEVDYVKAYKPKDLNYDLSFENRACKTETDLVTWHVDSCPDPENFPQAIDQLFKTGKDNIILLPFRRYLYQMWYSNCK